MKTNREEFKAGTSTLGEFWRFVSERHAVWIRRAMKMPAPWTHDPIIASRKFTNIFRELDRGTIALRRMERCATAIRARSDGDMLFNVSWYRMLNRREHAQQLGFVTRVDQLIDYVMTADPLFTGAHQTWLPKGCGAGVGVRVAYCKNFKSLWTKRHDLAKAVVKGGTLEGAFETVKGCVPGVGPFIAYEIVTDLRRTLLSEAPDVMTWCNINRGGGSARGLRRLGFEESPVGARAVLDLAVVNTIDSKSKANCMLPPHLAQHLPRSFNEKLGRDVLPRMELREIEHALCEFDKYERCRTGLGTTRGGPYRKRLEFDDGGFASNIVSLAPPLLPRRDE